MKNLVSYMRLASFLSLIMMGSCFMIGCAEEPAPPTKSKEERRTEQKEMMHREMNNK